MVIINSNDTYYSIVVLDKDRGSYIKEAVYADFYLHLTFWMKAVTVSEAEFSNIKTDVCISSFHRFQTRSTLPT